MEKTIVFILLLFINNNIMSQSFGLSHPLQINVNDNYYSSQSMKGIINATVKLIITTKNGKKSSCTGTLINRNTSDNNIGFYVLTARHCFFEDDGMGDMDFDSNADHYVVFNYQSPDWSSRSTPISNRGEEYKQSTSLTDNGYEYFHITKLRLVDYFFWGDFALVEILTPVPPHFNFTYAGWYPSKFGSYSAKETVPAPIVNIHHPKGDIKKINGTSNILWAENPIISTSCYTVTMVIDVLLGWIWDRQALTSVICNYVDNPWLVVLGFNYGSTEHGSSGSGIFSPKKQLLGVLSGGTDYDFGKLQANYSNSSIKNVMNPEHSLSVDLYGMSEKKITQYDNLTLPGGNTNGYYFPANHYQSENKITLRATNKIETTKPITVFSGADYEFVAGNSITLRQGFVAQSGSTFTARISNSQHVKAVELPSIEEQMIERLRAINLPEQLDFNEQKYFQEFDIDISRKDNILIYPNPTTGKVYVYANAEKVNRIEIKTIQGITVLQSDNLPQNEILLDISAQPAGIYLLSVQTENGVQTFKIVKN